MVINNEIAAALRKLFKTASEEKQLNTGAFNELCELCRVSKMYYDVNLGSPDRYRNYRTGNLVIEGSEIDGKLILFDNGHETGVKLTFPYFYEGFEYVHAYIEFEKGIKKEDLDIELYDFLADIVYIATSRRNMRLMLDFSEISDAQTGIPNKIFLLHKFQKIMGEHRPEEYRVLRINIQNFNFINETAGSQAGDEAVITYARSILKMIGENEGVCHLGGDNFAAFVLKENIDSYISFLDNFTLTGLKAAPGREFKVPAWIGVSGEYKKEYGHDIGPMLGQASAACSMAKNRFRRNHLYYTDELDNMIRKGRNIVAIFPDAVRNGALIPFYQAKVDMRTGLLMGFEALARWKHNGGFISPDQFIPVLEKESLVPVLDMAILESTCKDIVSWRKAGLIPPRISVNFSKKNLYIPDIEKRILDTVERSGLHASDIEIEITETLKESEYDRLIEFVNTLKKYGFHIAVDDFGTGYSSLSLIHNIDVDVIKIDKSFVDKLPGDSKSLILIESIVSIVDRLHFSTIAEGVETAEQGKSLLNVGCHLAQGYYYSKPADFEATTRLIADPPFEPIA